MYCCCANINIVVNVLYRLNATHIRQLYGEIDDCLILMTQSFEPETSGFVFGAKNGCFGEKEMDCKQMEI